MTELRYSIIEEPSCRIFLEEDDESNFIIPCNCSGTMKYVHKNCLNQWRNSVDYNPIRSIDKERYTTCGTCKEEYNYYDGYGAYSQCRLICLGIFDIVVVTIVLHLLYISCGWAIYGMGVKDFFIPNGNKYLNIYINGIIAVQTCVLMFYITRIYTSCDEPIFCICVEDSGDEGGVIIASIFIVALFMTFFFIYFDYVTKQYYRRKLF